jgi:hypothetical protein
MEIMRIAHKIVVRKYEVKKRSFGGIDGRKILNGF